MKRIALIVSAIFSVVFSFAQAKDQEQYTISEDTITLHHQVQQLENKLGDLEGKQNRTSLKVLQQEANIDSIKNENAKLQRVGDSLQTLLLKLSNSQSEDRGVFKKSIQDVQGSIIETNHAISLRTIWAIAIIVAIMIFILIIVVAITKKLKHNASSISDVRVAQDALQKAQLKIQEESIALDNKLADMMSKQLKAATTATNGKADHSLALKVADEIVRIELNLSRMDTSIKGYKQLSKAVQRIKDNFSANGYEIVDMLGKPYNEGMKVIANFVSDETLEQGKQIITGIIKPQINYNGKMIQSAQITVSQNI